jgi:hypothetical protein
MVHSMQNSVRPWDEEARALGEVGTQIEEAFPSFAHRVHAMRAIPMLKEGLKKYGRLPMDEKEGSDYHDSFSFSSLEPVPCDAL